MPRRRIIGVITMILSITAMMLYTYLLFYSSKDMQAMTLKLSVYVMIMIGLCSLLAIGYGLAKTLSIPSEEVRKELKSNKCEDKG
ncbi:MAG: hypothetical protein QXP02_04990 [Desulfurococcaceae archaeon]